MSEALRAAARRAGILLSERWGGASEVPDATLSALVDLIGEAPEAPPSDGRQAFVPDWLDGTRAFGVALQLYQLRSARNLGIGDLADLEELIPHLAAAGADFVGLNPLHALFTAAPERASPFSPSDRRHLNPLIVAVDRVPGYCEEMRQGVRVPSTAETVDYTEAARAKLTILRAIHALWRARDPSVPAQAQEAARAHRSAGGPALERFALFEALSHNFAREGIGEGWTRWPAAYQQADSPMVRAFAEAHADEIAFHAWLQYLAAQDVAHAQEAARSAGMRLGLYLDLAVGVAPDGAATWAEPDVVMRGVRLGAPPDLFSSDGQDWGLAPFSPAALIASRYEPYHAMLDAQMGPSGAIRIDHAMGLERLFLIPDGMPALDGAYVEMPGLTDALVEATHRNATLAIGEDLGVVPEGFRERMGERRIFSMRILPFEWDHGRMRPPSRYPRDALACLSTHDIAPLQAWWDGDDVAIRQRLGHIDASDAARARADRAHDKRALLALAGWPSRRADDPLGDLHIIALHKAIARSTSALVAVRLEDVVGGDRLVNLPGTDREHPNWRHTLPLTVEEIARSERLARVLEAVARERPRDPA